jgi:hypothetical protein
MGNNKAVGQSETKKGKKMGLASSKQPPKQETHTEEEPEWEVESIVSYRAEDKKYRVHWNGFSDSDDTWEPITNLENASVALHKYWTSKQAALVAAGAPANNSSRSAGAAKAKPQTGTPKVSGGVKKKKAPAAKSDTPKRS